MGGSTKTIRIRTQYRRLTLGLGAGMTWDSDWERVAYQTRHSGMLSEREPTTSSQLVPNLDGMRQVAQGQGGPASSRYWRFGRTHTAPVLGLTLLGSSQAVKEGRNTVGREW